MRGGTVANLYIDALPSASEPGHGAATDETTKLWPIDSDMLVISPARCSRAHKVAGRLGGSLGALKKPLRRFNSQKPEA